MKFNEKLKSLREAKGYTQDEIASKLNIARQSVSKWEQGINEPDFDTLKKLCVILDCSIADLIDDDKEIVSTKEEKQDKLAKWFLLSGLMVAIASTLILFAVVMYAQDTVIVHWNVKGEVELGSRWKLLIGLVPLGIMVAFLFFTKLLTAKNRYMARSKVMYAVLAFVLAVLVSVVVFVIVGISIADYNKGIEAAPGLTLCCVFAVMAAIGPFSHPKFNKRNPVFGFRSNLTLSSEVAWNKINAASAIVLSISALIGYVLTMVFMDKQWVFAFLAVIFIPMVGVIIYHEVVRKQIKNGQLK